MLKSPVEMVHIKDFLSLAHQVTGKVLPNRFKPHLQNHLITVELSSYHRGVDQTNGDVLHHVGEKEHIQESFLKKIRLSFHTRLTTF